MQASSLVGVDPKLISMHKGRVRYTAVRLAKYVQ